MSEPQGDGLCDSAAPLSTDAPYGEITSFSPAGMFVVTHVPSGPPVGGVVICSSVYAEFMRNYRREALLGRALAEHGMIVQRFHYRGSGNSAGDPSDLTFASMVQDTETAIALLRARHDVPKLAFVATRAGALAAARAAQSWPDAPLVLWEPVVEPARFFKEVFRALLIRGLKEGTSASSTKLLAAKLRTEGTLDVLGYPISLALYESLEGRTLEAEIGGHVRDVLLVEMSTGAQPRREYLGLANLLRDRGCTVELDIAGEREAWWFAAGGMQVSRNDLAKKVVATTVQSIKAWSVGRTAGTGAGA